MVDIAVEQAMIAHSGRVLQEINGIVQVIRCKLDAIAPVDSLAKLDGHLGEVVIVDRLLGGQGIIPYAVDARIRVDVPQRIQSQLLEAAYPTGAEAAPPAVEVIGREHSPVGVLQDQALIPGDAWRNFLSLGGQG